MLSRFLNAIIISPFFLSCALHVAAEPSHGVALFGEPDLSKSFESLPYASHGAPQGGRIVYGERGRFDSLNPFTVKGRAPSTLRTHVFESLMARNWDEPFTLYGLLAESIDIAADNRSVTFELHPDAAFSDGTPVTPDDVIFSMEILRDEGRPNFGTYYSQVETAQKTGERAVTFVFKKQERELPLILGLMPIHARHDWEGRIFADTTLVAPIASGPYRVESIDPGASITLRRRTDYWGKDLPINRGVHNFDEVTVLYFRDDTALWEAFKAGIVDLRHETDPARWLDGYDFPKAEAIKRTELPHGRATGMKGLVFNTRNPLFTDRRVRDALIHALDFEWINTALNRGAYARIHSYFGNSQLGHTGTAEGMERDLLLPFAKFLPPDTLNTAWKPPKSDGDGRNRTNLRTAARMLREVGWRIIDGVLTNEDGERFAFEILLTPSDDEKVAATFATALRRLGIAASIRLIDDSQYQTRLQTYDFDMIFRQWWLSLSPGAEQSFYFGSAGVIKEGTQNYMGADNPAIDAMIAAILSADNEESYIAAIRALDRVLTAERYVIPLWYKPVERIAWWKPFDKPDRTPLYGYRPEVWWRTVE